MDIGYGNLFFIKKVLEKLNFGGFLFYCDSRAVSTSSIRYLVAMSAELQ